MARSDARCAISSQGRGRQATRNARDFLEPSSRLLEAAGRKVTESKRQEVMAEIEAICLQAVASVMRGEGFSYTMPARTAANRHDALVEAALHGIVISAGATHAERSRAVQQARLPVKMGGLGLTSMAETLDAACVGSWALCWHQMVAMCPQLFAHVDIATYPLPAFKELRAAHKVLLTTRRVSL